MASIVVTTLLTSGSATLLASMIGIPLGAKCARRGGLDGLRVLVRTLYGLPPVVVGVLVYLMLSNRGPLSELDLLFTVPAGDREGALLEWDDMAKLPWGVLLLFGGGFALAAGITVSGLSAWIGGQLTPLSGMPLLVILFAIAAVLIFLTEITSNTATITTFLPIIAALAVSLGQPPLQLIVPVALAASFAFMFPVATPPNAIIFGTGRIRMQQMIRAGLVLNVLGIFVLGLFAYYILPLTLDLSATP